MIDGVRAVNEPGAADRVHDGEFARRLGFRGGLVPGAAVYGYLAAIPERRWGDAWRNGGTMSARFREPFYDGEEVMVAPVDADEGLGLEARNPARTSCAPPPPPLGPNTPAPPPTPLPHP